MRIEAVIGDITTQEVDAVVNAANSTLLGGGGVDGAIHRAAGPRLLEACRHLRATDLPEGMSVGQAVATPAFDLPARWVIHTVGPNRHAGQDDPALLRAAFDSSLALAVELGCRSLALPAVGAGAYGWELQEVARIAVASARALAERAGEPRPRAGRPRGSGQPREGGSLELIRFVLFSRPALAAFEGELEG
ncbi:O-acetyl-ADP-ribose deacetylase [Actinomyces capricornis]|uniref:Macro domain-containing protein n=1 Tax=Actinomyces capricornis TaxID=2755559 RepID=A0ABM7UG58_9ACTO|nr:O-acetyl-ADP-ribose deacetylase [Actinomyces capricornis]BDA64078.1 hypothetical protein MANAM107_09120 [Actinomyces capricornis]